MEDYIHSCTAYSELVDKVLGFLNEVNQHLSRLIRERVTLVLLHCYSADIRIHLFHSN
jgi:hypothetical protein